MDRLEIISDITDHIKSRGGTFFEWYVGVATSPTSRLFIDHNVIKKTDKWIYCPADSEEIARSVERHFIEGLSASGGLGGGINPTFVYAYKKSNNTDP